MKNFKFQISNFKLDRGFTLIELLLVMAVIGILASFMTANFIGVRERSRDTQRKSDLQQIRAALELYRTDEGSYPLRGNGPGEFPDCDNDFTSGGAQYMEVVPCDPEGGDYTYEPDEASGPCVTADECIRYEVSVCLENGNDVGTGTRGVAASVCPSRRQFFVRNP